MASRQSNSSVQEKKVDLRAICVYNQHEVDKTDTNSITI